MLIAETTFNSIINYEIIRGNGLWRIGLLAAAILLMMAAGRIFQFILQNYSEKIVKRLGNTVLSLTTNALSKPVYVFIIGIGIFVCKMPLYFNDADGIRTVIGAGWNKTAAAVIAIGLAYAAYRMVDVAEYYLNKIVSRTRTKLDDMLVPVIRKSLRIAIAIISILLIAENILGTDIKSLLLSAGVGGIAIALAAKDTIANFFGSITIFADRPFQIDEMIKIGSHIGPVEEVGFRSTRIRTLQGHLVTVPNSVMTNEVIENISKRTAIRRTSNVTITYDSGFDKTQKAISIIKEILSQVPEINSNSEKMPKVYFSDFNDCSLNIYMTYWVVPADYWAVQAINEKINFEILKRFDAEGIEFAFPTQTLHVKKDSDAPAN
ncbi:MAG: mechanosensitive ion channel family protein [Anaerohalosphaeraceae bacterium]|nr:mechanosensitive ion channel family protein [Anaerohalosphaeraceae bacterium]